MANEQRYAVYILSSRSRALYIGVTGNLPARIHAHRSGTFPGHTRRYRITRLLHVEVCDDVHDAIAREKQLKGWRRSKKVALIESGNPTWDDLAEIWFGTAAGTTGPSLRSG